MQFMKYNPFKPNGMMPPGAFIGRISELEAVESAYFQTKHGNPQHFFITGERGIGKSSLLLVNEDVAKGEMDTIDGHTFKFLTVTADLAGATTIDDIIKSIARGLQSTLNTNIIFKQKAKATWSFLKDWEILGVRYHSPDIDNDSEVRIDELVSNVAGLCSELSDEIDGIVFLLDEVDRPPVEADLGRFLKSFDERLFRAKCPKICFGLAGLPNAIYKMRESHPSSPRLFEVLTMSPLELQERHAVIDHAIEEANKINDDKVTVSAKGKDLLANISEGYPHFLQEFGHAAFSANDDDIIDEDDVAEGAFSENGALGQLGDKYFTEMYHIRINSDDYRKVLSAMANHLDAWVKREEIVKESGVSSTSVTNALSALKQREIILADDARKGYYRIPTKSFATWIRLIASERSD